MSQALADSLKSAKLLARDRAGVELAKHYAVMLDVATASGDGEVIKKALVDIGPKYLATLTALGLTPQGRLTRTADTTEGGGQDDSGTGGGKLDQLKQRRLKRIGQRNA